MSNSEQANEQHRQADTVVNAAAEMTQHKPDEHEQRQERETPRDSRVSTRNEELHRATVTTNGHAHQQDDEVRWNFWGTKSKLDYDQKRNKVDISKSEPKFASRKHFEFKLTEYLLSKMSFIPD